MAGDISLNDLEDLEEALKKSEYQLQTQILKREAWEFRLQKQVRSFSAQLDQQFAHISDGLATIQLQLQILEKTREKVFGNKFVETGSVMESPTPPPLPESFSAKMGVSPFKPYKTELCKSVTPTYDSGSGRNNSTQKVFDEMFDANLKVVCVSEVVETKLEGGVEGNKHSNARSKCCTGLELGKLHVSQQETLDTISYDGENFTDRENPLVDSTKIAGYDSSPNINGISTVAGEAGTIISENRVALLDERKVFDKMSLKEIESAVKPLKTVCLDDEDPGRREVYFMTRPIPKPPPCKMVLLKAQSEIYNWTCPHKLVREMCHHEELLTIFKKSDPDVQILTILVTLDLACLIFVITFRHLIDVAGSSFPIIDLGLIESSIFDMVKKPWFPVTESFLEYIIFLYDVDKVSALVVIHPVNNYGQKNFYGLLKENFVEEMQLLHRKRLISHRFDNLSAKRDIILCLFKIISGFGDKPMITVTYKGGEKFTAEQISIIVLIEMKEIAEVYHGSSVKNVGVTLFAYFIDSQGETTKIEPTVAAVTFGLRKKVMSSGEKNVSVLDLDGDTFDVSLVRIDGGDFEVKAIASDTHLGDEDVDNRTVHHFMEELKLKKHKDISGKLRALMRLMSACERLDKNLFSNDETKLEIKSLIDGIGVHSSSSHAKFKEMNMSLFKTCMKPVETCLRDANMNRSWVDDVVYMGSLLTTMRSTISKHVNIEWIDMVSAYMRSKVSKFKQIDRDCGYMELEDMHWILASRRSLMFWENAAYVLLLRGNESELGIVAVGNVAKFCRILALELAIRHILLYVKILSSDFSQLVMSASASVTMGMTLVLVKDATIDELLHILLSLLSDDFSDVSLNIMSKLDKVNQVIGTDLLSQSLLPSIVELAKDRYWRVRCAIKEYIPLLASQLGVGFFDDKLGVVCIQWPEDKVYSIRDAAANNLKHLAEEYGPQWKMQHIILQFLDMVTIPQYLNLFYEKEMAPVSMLDRPQPKPPPQF